MGRGYRKKEPPQTWPLTDPVRTLEFILAGDAIFTVQSRSGVHYTFKVLAPFDDLPAENPLPGFGDLTERRKNYDSQTRMVKVLTGCDNSNDYTYIGAISMSSKQFRLTKKSKMTSDSLPVKAISWLLAKLAVGHMPKTCKVWHEGRCGRCGQRLTVPESVEAGYGPDCIQSVRKAA